MTYNTPALEALDRKAGRVHTLDDWRRAGKKAELTPEALTEDDLVVLEAFGGPESAGRARIRAIELSGSTSRTARSSHQQHGSHSTQGTGTRCRL